MSGALTDTSILAGASAAGGYDIDQSLRFDHATNPYLTRAVDNGTPTSDKIGTLSFWYKYSTISTNQVIFSGGTDTSNLTYMGPRADDAFDFYDQASASATFVTRTAQVFRDVGSWYHFCWSVDSSQSTNTDRVHLYINGSEVAYAGTNTYPAQNLVIQFFKSGSTQWVSRRQDVTTQACGGYLAEVNYVDGQQLTPSSFGETNPTTNQWIPIEYTGTYGNNGFYQKYAATELANSFFDSGNGGRHVVTANGNAHTDTAVKKFGTASAQLDGTGDYLSIPDSADWDFGTDPFTWELWVKASSSISANSELISMYSGFDGFLRIMSNGHLQFRVGSGNSSQADGGTAGADIADDAWHHVAAVRESATSLKVFVDGSLDHSNTVSSSSVSTSGTLTIGAHSTGSEEFDGYMDEIRVSDIARYQTPFTAPTEAFDNDINTVLLLHCDGSNDGTSFPDSASHPITANGDVTQTRAQKKVGDSSIFFVADTGSYLSIPDSTDWELNSFTDYTVEMWVRTDLSEATNRLWSTDTTGSTKGYLSTIHSNGTIDWLIGTGSSWAMNIDSGTGAIIADSWTHVAFVKQSTTARIYVAGVQKTTGTFADGDAYVDVLRIGRYEQETSADYDGYIDEIRFSDSARYPDGTTFTPQTTEFTSDANTMLLIHSNWNGGLGADSSGNLHTFNPTNLVATDQMLDSPTNNFCTLSSIVKPFGTITWSEGNLKAAANNVFQGTVGTILAGPSGKWYWEQYINTVGTTFTGVVLPSDDRFFKGTAEGPQQGGTSITYNNNGYTYIDGSQSGSIWGATYTTGDIIGIAVDMDTSNGQVTFYKNGTSQGTLSFTSTNMSDATNVVPATVLNTATSTFNFGQDSSFAGVKTAQGNQDGNAIGDFYYTVPTGYLALCTSNLSDPSIKLPEAHFNTVLYTGSGGAQSITGVGFKPDWCWQKRRSGADSAPFLFDALRGQDYLQTDRTDAEGDGSAFFTSFDSDGFTLAGSDGSNNASSAPYVAWNWKAGGASTVTNNDGSIESEVSANTTAGFCIFTYTGTGAAGTVGHGLSTTPDMIIYKGRNTTSDWPVYYTTAGSALGFPLLNTTAAKIDSGFNWDSTVFTFTSASGYSNTSGTNYIAYAFNSVEGYSKIGTYVGNGNVNGTFVYTGFRPAYVMWKVTSAVDSWATIDNKINTYNPNDTHLRPNSADAEKTDSAKPVDYLSNGFKIRMTDGQWNTSGGIYLYYACAAYPFKYSNAR